MLLLWTHRHRLMLGMREKIQAPANPAGNSNNNASNGEGNISDKGGEEQRQAESGDDRPGRRRRQLDIIFALRGMVIVLHVNIERL